MKKFNVTIIANEKEITLKTNKEKYLYEKVKPFDNYKIKDNETNYFYECILDYLLDRSDREVCESLGMNWENLEGFREVM